MPYDIIHGDGSRKLLINGKIVDDTQEEDRYYYYVNGEFVDIKVCPYCHSAIICATHDEDYAEETFEVAYVAECQKCGYWQAYISKHYCYEYDPIEWEAQISKLSEFTEAIPDGCQQELAQYLIAKPSYWNKIDPTKLEKLVADIFRSNHAVCEVTHIGQPHDGGIDVVFVDSGKNKWLIQVKRRESETASEGVSTLRNLLGVLILEDTKYGMVVSTADHFTYWAYKSKEKASSKGYIIELIDRGKLQRLIEPLAPNRQWENLIAYRKPEWIPILSKKMPNRRQITIEEYLLKISKKHLPS